MEQEMLELNEQFATFLNTKGIKAKYKLVVENIKNGAKANALKSKGLDGKYTVTVTEE